MSDDKMREQKITLEANAWRNTNGPVCHSSFRGGFEAGERYKAACDSQQQAGEPVAWRSLMQRMRDDFDKLQRAVHFAGGFDFRYVSEARKLIAEADELLESSPQPQPDWVPRSERLPTETVPVLGYNADWVDGDFNPKGVRECVLYGDGTQWMTARWCDAHDCWITTYDHEAIPTHWLEYPEPPGGKNE